MILHALAKTYGQRPSGFVEGLSETEAFVVDLEAMKEGGAEEKRQTEMIAARAGGRQGARRYY